MLQVQSSLSSLNINGQIMLTELASSKARMITEENLEKDTSEKNSYSNFSQTLANYHTSISDQVKVGFFLSDRHTQTEESDILALNDAIENLIFLNKEMNEVKFDLKFANNSTESRFESELSNKSIEIYGFINKKIFELKKDQEENLQRIRRAYNSKLANAVIKLSASFADEYAKKKAYSAENRTNLTDSYIHKIKDLERSIVELEYSVSEAKRIAEENLKKIDPEIEEENYREVTRLKSERNKAMDEVESLGKKIQSLQEALDIKEEETTELNQDIEELTAEVQSQKKMNDEINTEFEEFKKNSEQEKKKLKVEFEKQKMALEAKMHEKLKESREQIVNAAKQELQQQKANQESDRQRLLEEQKSLLVEKEKEQKRMLDEQKQILADKEKEQKRILAEQKQRERTMLEKQQKLLLDQQDEKEKELARIKKEKTMEEEKLKEKLKETLNEAEKLAQAQAQAELKEREALMKTAKNARPEDLDLIIKLKTSEQFLKSEVARLNRDVAKSNETWEKKFDILKQNLHSIKEEMYLRQHFQKNSVNLAYASIAYTMDQPPTSYRDKTSTRNDAQKPILPSIGSRNPNDRTMSMNLNQSMNQTKISDRVDKDENYIIEDDEMMNFKNEFMKDIEFIPPRHN